jgi:hypothetical protein
MYVAAARPVDLVDAIELDPGHAQRRAPRRRKLTAERARCGWACTARAGVPVPLVTRRLLPGDRHPGETRAPPALPADRWIRPSMMLRPAGRPVEPSRKGQENRAPAAPVPGPPPPAAWCRQPKINHGAVNPFLGWSMRPWDSPAPDGCGARIPKVAWTIERGQVGGQGLTKGLADPHRNAIGSGASRDAAGRVVMVSAAGSRRRRG